MNKPFRFEKVKHRGSHQDYRVYWGTGVEHHIGNVRGGLKRNGRYTDWCARSDYDGTEIGLTSRHGRRALCFALLHCLYALGFGDGGRYIAGEIMQTTRDVGFKVTAAKPPAGCPDCGSEDDVSEDEDHDDGTTLVCGCGRTWTRGAA